MVAHVSGDFIPGLELSCAFYDEVVEPLVAPALTDMGAAA